MVAAHVAKIGKHRQPRGEYLWFQSEITGYAFHQLITGDVGINIIQISERQHFRYHPCRRIAFNIIAPEILDVIFLTRCQFLFYDSQCLVKFIRIGKIFRFCYPILVIQFLTSDVCQYASDGHFYLFYLIKEENTQLLVKAVERQDLLECRPPPLAANRF